jgi:hypothetical protein
MALKKQSSTGIRICFILRTDRVTDYAFNPMGLRDIRQGRDNNAVFLNMK